MRISFRYKIQAAVLLILFVTLASYIGLASQSLMKEKIASLLEITSADAEVISSRISRKLVAQEFWIEGRLGQGDSSKTQMELTQNSNLLSVVKKSGDRVDRIFDRAPEFASITPPFSAPKGLGFIPRTGEKNFWLTKIFDNGDSVFTLWSQDIFSDEQKNYDEGSLLLFSSLNQEVMVLSQDALTGKILADVLKKESLPKTLSSKRMTVQDTKFVQASNPVEYFPLFSVVVFPEAIALASVQDLQLRSLYFALVVIGLTGLLSFWIGRALTQKLRLLTEDTAKIAQGDLDSARPIQTNDEIGDLSKSIVSMAGDLKKYIRDVAEKSRMEAELKTAKTVQEMLFPEKSYVDKNFEVHGYYESASECGGDLWFYWKTEPYLFFIIADATGHGAPAALITSAARSTLAGVQHLKETKIVTIAEMLHHSVKESSKGTILMTAWMGRLHLESGEIEYVNCSHEPVFLVNLMGKLQVISGINNPRIGDQQTKTEGFEVGHIKLEPGDRLCLYTDGLSDVETESGQRYSERKFSTLFTQYFSMQNPIAESIQSLVAGLKDFSGHRPLEDDITMVVVGRKN